MSDPREAFEAHFKMPPYEWDADAFRRATPIGAWPSAYARYETEIAWESWQASRAAALEEAAKACEDEATIEGIAQRCAARIRALGAK